MKQVELARLSDISPSYLNLIEHNRRAIAGKVLLDIATALDLSPSELSEGPQAALVSDLQKLAAVTGIGLDVANVEEYVSNFPDWAQQTARLQSLTKRHERTIEMLNDRLTHDPFLSESLHEILSNVTAIRSTSGILSEVADIQPGQRARFLANLLDESARLTETSKALASYFDQEDAGERPQATPLDEFESFIESLGYSFAFLDAKGPREIPATLERSRHLTTPGSKALAERFLRQYCEDAEKLPLVDFLEWSRKYEFQPDRLAMHFGVNLTTVFRRLAFLPSTDGLPDFGLVVCDVSGAIVVRKPVPGFPLPRYGAACPLWPLYQSIAQPDVALKTVLKTPEGVSFQSYAVCRRRGQPGFGQPQQLQATMLFYINPVSQSAREERLSVGLNCRICPVRDCQSRREPSIIAM